MADEPNEKPEDIQGILSDLDAILSGMGETAEKPPRAAAPAEAAPPKAAEPVKPPEIKPVPPPPASPPAEQEMKIELAPRAGSIPPAPKPVEPPKAVEIPKPVEPPKPEPAKPAAPLPVPPPSPAVPKAAVPPAAPAASEDIPAATPKDQIRRVAYVYTFSCAEACAGFAAYLAQAARTISKKPIYLRRVMMGELGAASDPFAVFEKARDAKAVAVLAVVDGWPPAKIEGLSEACARGGLLFRAVVPTDVQKKSTAVDVLVDMMLLNGEE